MVSRSSQVCKSIIRFLVTNGFTNQAHEREIEKAIIYERGPDKRTLKNWKNALESLGFIRKIRPSLYELNLLAVPELLTEIVKEDRKQKKLM